MTPLLLVLAGCLPAGVYELRPQGPTDLTFGTLAVSITARLDHQPHQGFDLEATVTVRNLGQATPRVDFGRTLVRSDGVVWEPCHQPVDVPADQQIQVIEPGEQVSFELKCRDIRRPSDRIEVRFYASGIGTRGVIEASFEGVTTASRVQ